MKRKSIKELEKLGASEDDYRKEVEWLEKIAHRHARLEERILLRLKRELEELLKQVQKEYKENGDGKKYRNRQEKIRQAEKEVNEEIRRMQLNCPRRGEHFPRRRYHLCPICGHSWDDTPDRGSAHM